MWGQGWDIFCWDSYLFGYLCRFGDFGDSVVRGFLYCFFGFTDRDLVYQYLLGSLVGIFYFVQLVYLGLLDKNFDFKFYLFGNFGYQGFQEGFVGLEYFER